MIDLNDVLLAMSNIPVDDPIAEIWGRGLQGGYKIIEYTGTLPITITANGDALLDYRIYGTDGGVGVATENLFDKNANDVNKGYVEYAYLTADGTVNTGTGSSNFSISEYISLPLESETIFLENIGTISAPGIAICFYDDSQVYISGKAYGAIASLSVQKPSNATLCRVTFLKTRASIAYVGTIAPESYIPYGYKLPMNTYKQELMVTNDMLDQSNWVLAGAWFMYFDITDFISKEECDAKVYKNFTDGYVPQKLVVAITDARRAEVDEKYRILNNNGVILNKKFDFSSWNKIYLCIGYGNMYRDEYDKQSKINELFGNWKILIAPTNSMQETPVYIGENQLTEDEYVSYGEQKIYRDISGTLTPTDPPVPLPEIPTLDGTTVIDYDGDPKPSQMYVKYKDNG